MGFTIHNLQSGTPFPDDKVRAKQLYLPVMSTIDAHTHAFPDDIAARAMAKLEEMAGFGASGNGTAADLVASMDAADIDVSVTCTIATKPGQAKGILKWCRKIRSNRIDPLASVHPDDRNAPKLIENIAAAELAGIKLHPLYQDFAADESRMDDIYSALADTGLLLAAHSGQDFAFPQDDDRASPRRWAAVADRHPQLKLLCTHMGGYLSWDQVEQCLLGRDVYVDTSFSLAELGADRAADLIRRHGVDRVLFGTDWPWADQATQVRLLDQLPLDQKAKDAIRWTNAAKLLGY